jgi:hypothetical protein
MFYELYQPGTSSDFNYTLVGSFLVSASQYLLALISIDPNSPMLWRMFAAFCCAISFVLAIGQIKAVLIR